jgi:hypothetical protein
VQWIRRLWFPFYLFCLNCSTMQSRFMRGAVFKTIPCMNTYEGLTGTFFLRLADSVPVEMIKSGLQLMARSGEEGPIPSNSVGSDCVNCVPA